MRLFQPDESEAEMCGNHPCLAKYAFDNGMSKAPVIQTLAGPVNLKEI